MLKILKYNIFFLLLFFFSNSLNADIKIISWGGEYQNTQDKIYGKLYSEIFNKKLSVLYLILIRKNIDSSIFSLFFNTSDRIITYGIHKF